MYNLVKSQQYCILYSLQKELAPSVDYIVSGERSVVFGSVEFTDVDKKQEIFHRWLIQW